MPIVNKDSIDEVNKYNEFVKQSKYTNHMQDLRWGKVKSSWIQEAVYIEENGKITHAMTVRLKKIPYFNSYFAYASRGPVCAPDDMVGIDRLIKELDTVIKKYNVYVLKFDPEILYSQELEKKYRDAGYKVLSRNKTSDELIQPRYNMLLYISGKSEDDIFKGFSEKTRYNIRLAKRKGVEVRYSKSEEDLKIFYELYKVTCKRDKIGCRDYEYFENMLEAYNEDEIRIYIASYENENLASAININYGGKSFYIYGASSNEKRNLMPNYLMQWEMIRWAIQTNCKNYDFGGVLVLDKENGLYKFKSGFCKQEGVTELIGEVDIVYNPFIYFIYYTILPMKKKITRFIRNIKRKLTKKV